MSRLKKDDIIICLEDFYIPGTGMTFRFYKNRRYILYKYLPLFASKKELGGAWEIRLQGSKYNLEETGYMTEEDLFKKFDCVKHQRKEKLIKLNEI